MTPEIKDFKTWAEAELWLARHGWGTALIEQQKQLWEADKAVVATKPTVKATAKTAEPATK